MASLETVPSTEGEDGSRVSTGSAEEVNISVKDTRQEAPEEKETYEKRLTFGEKLKMKLKRFFPKIFHRKVRFPPAQKCSHIIDSGDATPIRAHGQLLSLVEYENICEFMNEGLRDETATLESVSTTVSQACWVAQGNGVGCTGVILGVGDGVGVLVNG
ncbi:uncharacterized protein STEHIDRAFT_157382 [Stereum hirsutum FP-91666 SS1]|uniref:uncharacterized protein n=1 Tax=Stereum hirsutum (strain FP-91666) TaxID=721885 RepID=UPI000444A7AB|nr:uncharacterized protein STEHIDRAFT_157382 [Stereum hirsutum FP-91666 SS1]EIM85846.1 hypothetical protein STEHIDRAFT_157382 [Stereum hirsutum FP-91666 SS1]